MNDDPHVQRILDWRESFAVLPDSHFFELMRMYLGEVRTPFNKQKLIEQLGSFLRKEEHRKKLVSLLSESDLLLISAVKYIPKATQEKLSAFFKDTFKFAFLYERLLNLEERLIIYRHIDKQTNRQIVSINPMLEDVLKPFTSKSILLKKSQLSEVSFDPPFSLSPEFLISVISFIQQNPDLCKNDGAFKKKALSEIEKKFPGKAVLLSYLVKAFENLSLIKNTPSGYSVDYQRFKTFARLKEHIQYAYLCVSSQGRFSRGGLVRQAKLLLDCAYSIPEEGYSREAVLRSSFLITEKANEAPGVSSALSSGRFAQILSRAREQNNEEDSSITDTSAALDRLIDAAVEAGLLNIKGKDEEGKPVYVTGQLLLNDEKNDSEKRKVLSVDAGFTVSVMPGLSLANLLELIVFMDLDQFDTVASFVINRKSVMRAFDAGYSGSSICDTLKDYSMYEVPQNLSVSIDDWSRSYSSAAIYKGYILQVSPENCTVTEKNPAIAPYIAKTLVPGIYLLSVTDDEQAQDIIEKSGLDFIGSIKTAQKQFENADFPLLMYNPAFASRASDLDYSEVTSIGKTFGADGVNLSSEEERCAHFDEMRRALNALSFSKDQKEGLEERIRRKIILSEEQLRGDSVRFERLEASGMDFSGKIHVIDSAVTGNSMIELEYDNPDDINGESIVIMGTPLSIEKNELDAAVHMIVEPEHEERTFSIGQARFVKKMRGSVFKA